VSVRCRRLYAGAALLAGSITAAPLVAVPAMAADGGRPLSATLTGAAEVPTSGDPDGIGSASVRVNVGKKQVCVDLTVSGIAPALAAHIHEAPAGIAGPVVVPLDAPTTGTSSNCYSITRQLAKEILKDPADYYVNVHNAAYPAGALRGQLG
jgi:hypothetical protein